MYLLTISLHNTAVSLLLCAADKVYMTEQSCSQVLLILLQKSIHPISLQDAQRLTTSVLHAGNLIFMASVATLTR